MINKIFVFGDSITYGKWDESGGWVQRLRNYIDQKYNLGQEEGNVQVYNMGIPGDFVGGVLNRFQNEFEARFTNENEKILIIFAVGINDSNPNNWKTQKQTPPQQFKENFLKMVKVASRSNCQIMVLGLTPVNPAKSKKLGFTNEKVKEYDLYISEICREAGVTKIELFDNLLASDYSENLVDSVHPDSRGHEMIFQKVLAEISL